MVAHLHRHMVASQAARIPRLIRTSTALRCCTTRSRWSLYFLSQLLFTARSTVEREHLVNNDPIVGPCTASSFSGREHAPSNRALQRFTAHQPGMMLTFATSAPWSPSVRASMLSPRAGDEYDTTSSGKAAGMHRAPTTASTARPINAAPRRHAPFAAGT